MLITLFILLYSSTFTYALYPSQISRRNTSRIVPKTGYYDPREKGGSLLTVTWVFHLFCETASCSFCWTIVREWHRPTRPRGTAECHHLWKFGPSCFGRRNNKWWSKELFSVCLRTILRMLNDLIVFRSIGFAGECLGQHIGDAQTANLGDGSGYGRSLLCTLYSVVFLLHILQRTRHLKSVTILGILSSDPARKR